MVDAQLEHGLNFIFGREGVHSGDKANTQNGKQNTPFEQAVDHVHSHDSHFNPPEYINQQPLIGHLASEIDYLRSRLDKQVQFLADSTTQSSNMMAKLKPATRRSCSERIRQKFPVNSAKNEPDTGMP